MNASDSAMAESGLDAREKSRVAVSSMVAAVGLTSAKLAIGLMTRSLGILSEAAHSALDLVAAAATVFAVRASARPADENHPYGHGKVESLSALFETFLLLLTCVWIVWEVIQRLFFQHVQVEASAWGFGVIGVSIVVDVSRSRALMKIAKKHNSHALAADALHFSTDVWSSSVVLFGLALVALSHRFHQPWLIRADALAALTVAGIVIWVSVQLGWKTLADLMDTVPAGLVDRARSAVLAVPGVEAAPKVRMRRIGGDWFSDVLIRVPSGLSAEEAHAIADAVESALKPVMPSGDIVVHVEPARKEELGALP
jgi:cation diffusion facilitator family transporter